MPEVTLRIKGVTCKDTLSEMVTIATCCVLRLCAEPVAKMPAIGARAAYAGTAVVHLAASWSCSGRQFGLPGRAGTTSIGLMLVV